ncbi:hypothetical protein ABZ054_20400, partial [Streptomyces sp. NPDC006324]
MPDGARTPLPGRRIRTPVDGVHHLAARNEEVLGALSVAAADRAAAAGLPPWRAAEHLASRTLLRFLLREVGEDAGDGPPSLGCRSSQAAAVASSASAWARF